MADEQEKKPYPYTAQYDPKKDLMQRHTVSTPTWGEDAEYTKEIPFDSEDPEAITINKGIPSVYAKDPVNGGKFLELGDMNGILKTITKQMKMMQLHTGFFTHSPQYQLDIGGYPHNAFIRVLYCDLSGRLFVPETLGTMPDVGVSSTERLGKAQTLLLRSLIPDNQDDPLEIANLYRTYEVVDGVRFGQTIDLLICNSDNNRRFMTPPGYLDIAPPPEVYKEGYLLDDYPRVKVALKVNGGVCGHFLKKDRDKFIINHLGGLFARVYNNNSLNEEGVPVVQDPGRAFNEIQKDAMGIITGAVRLASQYIGSDSYGRPSERVATINAFSPIEELPEKQFPMDHPDFASLHKIPSFNAFKVGHVYTTYDMDSSEEYRYQCIYRTSVSSSDYKEAHRAACGNTLILDTSDHPRTAHEVRPKNYAVKRYIKV